MSRRVASNSATRVTQLQQRPRCWCATMTTWGSPDGEVRDGRGGESRMRAVIGLAAIVALISVLQADPAGAEPKIGVPSAARDQVQGVMRGGARTLSAGCGVFSNEDVRTGDDSPAR